MGKPVLNPEYGLYEKSGRPFCSSRQMAETFEKRHDHVLRDIQNAKENMGKMEDFTPQFWGMNFIESQYKERGRFFPEYLLTKDGFSLIAMGFSGKKAMAFKIAYIKRFNDMEAFIKSLLAARFEFPAFTDAVMQAHDEPKFYHYSNELNMINKIVLGMDAKQYKKMRGIAEDEKSIRPYLTTEEVSAIEALQRADIGLLIAVPEYSRRKEILIGLYQRLKNGKALSAA